MAEPEHGSSPLAEALARVGDRWTLLVVEALLPGPLRFNGDGLLVARPYSQRPPRADYHLTAEGIELAGALRLLAHWGSRHTDQDDSPRHPACGTPIEVRWYCPTCDQLVDHDPDHPQAHFV
jgi:DNA-binding HxlR family transcriptional regulator